MITTMALAILVVGCGKVEMPKVVSVNYLPLIKSSLPGKFGPNMLGSKPEFEISDHDKIDELIGILTNKATDIKLSATFVNFVFRFDGNTVYVDRGGVVLFGGNYYITDPIALEDFICKMHPVVFSKGTPVDF